MNEVQVQLIIESLYRIAFALERRNEFEDLKIQHAERERQDSLDHYKAIQDSVDRNCKINERVAKLNETAILARMNAQDSPSN